MVSKTRSTSSGARPSEGSSSRSRRGRASNARAMASCCCSPPESVRRGAVVALRSTGNSSRMRSTSPRDRARSRRAVAPSGRFSATRQRREDVAALGHQRDAAAHDPFRGVPGSTRPSKHRRRRCRPQRAGDRGERAGLAGAVRAREADDLARVDPEGDAAHRADASVADVQILNLAACSWARLPPQVGLEHGGIASDLVRGAARRSCGRGPARGCRSHSRMISRMSCSITSSAQPTPVADAAGAWRAARRPPAR